uniref:Uncharacterized protein n=1 Tax=Caenorhabditis japonica TaxID=281687 RepID=A0A8R1IXJ2_CAEJA
MLSQFSAFSRRQLGRVLQKSGLWSLLRVRRALCAPPPVNVIHQIDIHSQLLPYQIRTPDLSKTGILDDALWQKPIINTENSEENVAVSPLEASPHGQIVDFTADIIEPEQLREFFQCPLAAQTNKKSLHYIPLPFSVSARWLLYSLFLTVLLCLLILMCIICYWCVLRQRSIRRADSGSQRTIMRDSPDYAPVKMRTGHSQLSLNDDHDDDDESIGTDDTDLQAYRDIPSHRVKIYRESVSFIVRRFAS